MKTQLVGAIAAVFGLTLFGCSNSDAANPDTGSYPVCELTAGCTPSVHHTQGDRGDPREFQRYRLLGASSDGHRLAVLYSHFGPSSFVSFVNLIIYEADTSAFVYQLTLTGDPAGEPGSEEELTALETQVLADSATALTDAGIAIDEHVPQGIAWCEDAAAIVTDHCLLPELVWSVAPSACPGGAADPAAFWHLCSTDPDVALTCATETRDPYWDCQGGELALVDIYWFGDTLWAIAQRDIVPLPKLSFSVLTVGGTVVGGGNN